MKVPYQMYEATFTLPQMACEKLHYKCFFMETYYFLLENTEYSVILQVYGINGSEAKKSKERNLSLYLNHYKLYILLFDQKIRKTLHKVRW